MRSTRFHESPTLVFSLFNFQLRMDVSASDRAGKARIHVVETTGTSRRSIAGLSRALIEDANHFQLRKND